MNKLSGGCQKCVTMQSIQERCDDDRLVRNAVDKWTKSVGAWRITGYVLEPYYNLEEIHLFLYLIIKTN